MKRLGALMGSLVMSVAAWAGTTTDLTTYTATDTATNTTPPPTWSWPQPPAVAAKSWLLIDLTSNQILGAKDPDLPIEPASLTKLMTAYLAFGALRDKKLDLAQLLNVSEAAWKVHGSKMFVEPRKPVSVEHLLRGMIVQSGNDASIALAEGIAGSVENFVALMNRQARAMGLHGTAFQNPTGLPAAGHHSTARDLATLATRLVRDFPQYYAYYSAKEFTYNRIQQPNRNRLLFVDPTVDGLKTGHTERAGYSLVASSQRAFPNGRRRLLSVVIGADSELARANESHKLLNWGFQAFDALKLYDAGQAVVAPQVWKGQSGQARLGSSAPVYVSVPRGEADQVRALVERIDPLVAPLRKGQVVGTLKITIGVFAAADVPLTVLDGVDQAGLLGRGWDALRLWLQ